MDPEPQENMTIDLRSRASARAEEDEELLEDAGADADEGGEEEGFRPFSLIEWEALEFEAYPKPRWAKIAGPIAAVLLTAYAVWTGNYFFAVFVALASFLVYLFSIRSPRVVSSAVTSHGVRIGNRLFLFDDLKSFWIFYEPGGMKELSLESKRSFLPYVRTPLGPAHPLHVRDALVKYVPERQHEESLTEALIRYFGL